MIYTKDYMVRQEIVQEAARYAPGADPEELEVPQLIPTRLSRHDVFVTRSKDGKRVARTRSTIESPEFDTDITDKTPVLWVPGYGGIKPAYRRPREATVQFGRPSTTYRPVRDISLVETLHPANVLHPELLARRTLGAVIDHTCEYTESGQVDLACHSMGGFIAALTAEYDPTKIRSIVFIASAGLEDHNLLTLAKRAPGFLRRELLPHISTLREENEARMALEALDYFLRNPPRTLAEGFAVANCNIREIIAALRGNGIMMGCLLFGSDELFIEDNIRTQAGDLFHIIETYEDDSVGHMGPQLHGQAVARHVVSQTARLVELKETLTPEDVLRIN